MKKGLTSAALNLTIRMRALNLTIRVAALYQGRADESNQRMMGAA